MIKIVTTKVILNRMIKLWTTILIHSVINVITQKRYVSVIIRITAMFTLIIVLLILLHVLLIMLRERDTFIHMVVLGHSYLFLVLMIAPVVFLATPSSVNQPNIP